MPESGGITRNSTGRQRWFRCEQERCGILPLAKLQIVVVGAREFCRYAPGRMDVVTYGCSNRFSRSQSEEMCRYLT